MRTPARRGRVHAAFSLMELMIAVAIIAMLAAIAVPQYQDYVARTQFSEAMSLFGGIRTAVESHVQMYGLGEALERETFLEGLRTQGEYVEDVTVSTSADTVSVVIRFASEGVSPVLAGESVTLTREAADDPDEAGWSCDPDGEIAEVATGICERP